MLKPAYMCRENEDSWGLAPPGVYQPIWAGTRIKSCPEGIANSFLRKAVSMPLGAQSLLHVGARSQLQG